MILCPYCHRQLEQAAYCATCGRESGDGNYCAQCGNPYAGPNFCPVCGYELSGPPTPLSVQEVHGSGERRPTEVRSRRRWRRTAVGCGCLPGSVLVLLILLGAAEGDLRALGISIVAAIVPAMVYCWIILSLDRYENEPLHVVAFAFGWGAVGAILFTLVASLVFHQFVFVTAGANAASTLSIVVGAPVIEEACKGLAILLLLWFYRHELDSVLDGLVYGALVGIGFAMTENVLYFITAYRDEGLSGLGELFVIRAVVNGFGHAMYTGVIGAAIGWSRARYSRGSARVLVPIAGYLIGVLLHMLWNAGILLIAAWQGDDASWFSVMIIEVPLFVVPPLVILYLIARRGYQHERQVMATQLVDEVELGVLSQGEYDELIDHRKRKKTMAGARRQGWSAWRNQRQFYAAAGDIAFNKHHVIEGQRPNEQDRIAIHESRAVLSRMRALMIKRGAGKVIGVSNVEERKQ